MKIAILGAGESGVGAALLARQQGATVWVSDAGQIQEKYRQVLSKHDLPFEEGKHTEATFFEADIVIKSPGIPGSAPLVQALAAAGKPVISEIEFAARHCPGRIIALTGTNGKTTTTALTHHLMQAAGLDAALGGNIGRSFAGLLAESRAYDWYVLEISSFQLDDIQDFCPDIALLLNITPDHLDRYEGSMDRYAAAKFRITENQQSAHHFIYAADDPGMATRLAQHPTRAQRLEFGLKAQADRAAWMEGSLMQVLGKPLLDFSETQLLGPHNQLNALAAALAVLTAGGSREKVAAGLRSFRAIEHRLEPVGTFGGVTFINDSKATNVDAVGFALQSMTGPTLWLAGGVDKGNDYGPLAKEVDKWVKGIVVIGGGGEKLRQAFPKQPLWQTESMQEAVTVAREQAEGGDTVLLSPACASFDRFRNYEDRGRQFKAAIQAAYTGEI